MICFDSAISDIGTIARIHIRAFPKSLSSRLGFNYCHRMISWYLDDARGELFHLSIDKNIVGYCGGLIINEPGKHGSATSVTQYTFKALVISFLLKPWLIFHPEIRTRLPFIVKNIKLKLKPGGTTATSGSIGSNPDFIPSMGLVVIGVDPEYQGKGYGSVLLKEFERRAREKGLERLNLSVRCDNEQAISAYLKNGWVIGTTGEEELSMFKIL